MSMAFLTQNSDDPVIWRGPMKMTAVRQFLGDAIWGDLDYLVCDLPPGTSDCSFNTSGSCFDGRSKND